MKRPISPPPRVRIARPRSSSERSRRGALAQWLFLAVALAAIFFSRISLAQEAAIPKAPARWATDTVGLLAPHTVRELDAQLEAYQRRTGHQVVVWIGGSTGQTPLDEFAVRSFESWKIGRKGVDDGILILVLSEDRKLAIEVGYGLEDRVPDAVASRIVNEVMAPGLKAGDPDGAVRAGTAAVLSAIEGKPFETVPGAEQPGTGHPGAEPRAPPSVLRIVVLVIVGLLFLVLLITNPALALHLLLIVGGRGLGGGGGGGGFGGGGFSGGGGRSGGGGARGSW